jgi:MFS family permease
LEAKARRDIYLIYCAAFLRSLGIGLVGVLLGVYLYRRGFSSTAIGLVIAAGLAGAAVATVVVSLRGDRLGRRRMLITLALLGVVGGLGLAFAPGLAALLPLAFIGMLNAMGTDRTASFALEQAVIPGLVHDERRTWAFSCYHVVLDAGHALGALAAGLPVALERWRGVDPARSYHFVFLGYAALNLFGAVAFLFLSPAIEIERPPTLAEVSHETKRIVTKLAALFSLDAFGGGFLTDALVAYWFFRRFGTNEESLGVLFFVVHLLNAGSHLGAAWLARRFGLVNTMVFTHLPSSVFLMAVPFAPSLPIAVVLFLLRESLVEMDVPTRQSYITAVVRPEERTFASGVTNLTRNSFWAVASSLAGFFMQHVAFGAPLVVGGGLKVIYDGLLYRSFRNLRPPEERGTA